MTLIWFILTFMAGACFGVFAIAILAMSSDGSCPRSDKYDTDTAGA